MKLTNIAVNRPILTTMIALIVIMIGMVALVRLPIDLMPDITSPTISIITNYSNADPLAIEELITRPIEEAVSAVPGVEEISSQSSIGSSSVRVSFNWGTDLEAAANDLRDRIDRVISRLPSEASRPALRKFDMSATPVTIYGVTSSMDPVLLRILLDEQVKHRLERVEGVASIDIRGGREREIHVNIDLHKLQSLSISPDLVVSRIRSANVNVPLGEIYKGNYQVSIRIPGVFNDLDQLANTTIITRNGSNILLKEIAEIEKTANKVTRFIRINREPAVQIAVNKQSGTNTVEVVKGVQEEIDLISQVNTEFVITPLIDTSVFIRQSINNVTRSALIGAILALIILLLFLRNVKSTAVIATAIPISIIATFGLLYYYGFTLNLMTLGGLALGIGSLLDNSIVVLENIFRHREKGIGKIQAAIKGTEEVTAPIIASTLTSVVVFIPIVFMQGMTGIMFKQLAIVIVFSMVCALITALTLVPMLSSRMLTVNKRAINNDQHFFTIIFSWSKSFLTRLETAYTKILKIALANRGIFVFVTIIVLAGSLAIFPLIDKELLPQTDEGEIRINYDMEAGIKLDIIDNYIEDAEDRIFSNISEVTNIITTVGGTMFGGSSSNTGQSRISLVPRSERNRSDEAIANEIRRLISDLPGVRTRIRTASNNMMTRILSRGDGRVSLQIRGHDQNTAYEIAGNLVKSLETVDGLTDINYRRSAGAPEELLIVDRIKAAEFGFSIEQVANVLKTVLAGTQAGYFTELGKEYPIRVQIKNSEDFSLNEILNYELISSSGKRIALKSIVHTEESFGSTMIQRVNQERVLDVSANVANRSIGAVNQDIIQKISELDVPFGYSVELSGDYQEQQRAFRELLLGVLLAIALIFAVMAGQYESLKDPFIVMFSVPLAVIGVIFMLFLTNTSLNMQSYIGLIMLGGIVVNNAILLVDTTNKLYRNSELTTHDAIIEAGKRRLRPIMMTALTTILGMIPLAIGFGEGGELQAPLARVVIGGLFSSTLITLIIIPVIYSLFEGNKKAE